MMATIQIENLDLACACAGKSIAEHPSQQLRKLITDALSVLEEEGVYALFLFLNAQDKGEKEKRENINAIWNSLENLLISIPQRGPLLPASNKISGTLKGGRNNAREAFLVSLQDNLTSDIEKLLLTQSVLRQTLIYARYHA